MGTDTADPVVVSLDDARELATRVFTRHGLSADQTKAVVDVVIAAERDACTSHGLFRVPGYVASLTSGKVDPNAVPTVTDAGPGIVRVDAGGGFAPLALEVGRAPLAAKAREQGIAALAIVDVYHFAALWPEVEALADEGLVAFAFTAAMRSVAPAGGTEPLYGTNPMAFAWPRKDRPPLVFDQAASASARGEIMLHERDGKPLPEGWAIDRHGEPTTDPTAALAGAQLPFGGHKGAAIALMVELLAGALIGEVFSYESSEQDNGDGGPPLGGEFLIAIDPARCTPGGDRDAQLAHAERLFAKVLDQDGTRLPSDRRFEARGRTPIDGITVPASLFETLTDLAGS